MSGTPQIYCQATLNYAVRAGIAPTEVTIFDGRTAPSLRWQVNGFERLDQPVSITHWTDDAQLQQHHYQEMAELAKHLSGCRKVIVSGHISRNPEQARKHTDYAPIQFVHSDFTDNYGHLLKQRYAKGLEVELHALARADVTLDELNAAEHLLILQFWRNVGAARPDLPLAFCDAQTVPRADLLAFNVPNYAGGDFAFDTFGVQPPTESGRHRWYSFPALSEQEVIAFRTFDSRRVADGTPFWTPHCAFRDPTVPADAPPRRSIELRATCLF